jgi:hypothetical protein
LFLRHRNWGWFLAQILLVTLVTSGLTLAEEPGIPSKRKVRIDDAITINRLADTFYSDGGSPRGRVARFSPNGVRFVVVVKQGNLIRNTNNYSVLLFNVTRTQVASTPRLLFTMSSNTNHPAIQGIKWLGDNQTIAFIGEHERALPQIYCFNTRTGRLSPITHEQRRIRSFDMSSDGRVVLFTEDRPSTIRVTKGMPNEDAVVVTGQSFLNLLDWSNRVHRLLPEQTKDLFVKSGAMRPIKIPIEDAVLEHSTVSLSNNGSYGLVKTYVRHVPQQWKNYKDVYIQQMMNRTQRDGDITSLFRYVFIDTQKRIVRNVTETPSEPHRDAVAWAPNGKSVVLSGVFLPFEVHDSAEREQREHSTYVVEVQLPTLEVSKVSQSDLKISHWDSNNQRILLESAYWWKDEPGRVYAKVGTVWNQVPATPSDLTGNTPFRVALKEDLNTPPQIVGVKPATNQTFVILELNPKLREVALARVEYVRWTAKDGHDVEGGLYFPPDYQEGRRYPLVIQTHGFTRDRFWIDGPFTSVFAAQALAAHGMMVLQVGGSPNFDDFQYLNSAVEGPRQMAAYEGAIDYLDGKGLIEKDKVGLVGFSRTVFAVEYTLTHSSYPMAAAIVADGFDGGYFQYLVFRDMPDYVQVNGGVASGENLANWIERSPGFTLHHLQTPVRIETYGPGSVVVGWEWFAGLTRLDKPVEYIYYPEESHTLVKPRDRQTSLEGTVEWFSFWLKGERNLQRPDQDRRWQELRAQEQRKVSAQ